MTKRRTAPQPVQETLPETPQEPSQETPSEQSEELVLEAPTDTLAEPPAPPVPAQAPLPEAPAKAAKTPAATAPLPASAPVDMDALRAELVRVMGVPKPKGQVPTLVTYSPKGTKVARHILVDIGEPMLKEAWGIYRANVEGAEAEDFLLIVFDITEREIPRMYRTVAKLSLD